MSQSGKTERLDAAVVKGVAWTAGAKWVTQLFSWAALVITARLLNRADYGVGEMAGFFFALTNSLAEFGVGTAVLHMDELDEDKIHQLHGFSMLLCGSLYLLSLLLSPLIGWFFHRTDLFPVLAVTNLAFFITGLQAVPNGLLQRALDYRRLSLAEGALYLFQAAVTIVCAYAGMGYWALILGPLCGKALNAALTMFWQPVGFSFPKLKDIRAPLSFGGQASIGNVATTALLHSDVLVIGRVLGDSALGTYRMAAYLASAPAEKISMLIMRTAGPLFANVQSDPVLVRRYFMHLIETLNLLVVPAMTGLVVLAPEIVQVVLGGKWMQVVMPLSWLAAYMVISTINSVVSQVLVSQRQTKLTMRLSFLNLFVMPLAFVIGVHWGGTAGVASAWVIGAPVTAIPAAILLFRKIELSWMEFFKTLLPTLFAAACMAGVLIFSKGFIASQHWPPVTTLTAGVVTGAVVYGSVLMVFFPSKLTRYSRLAGYLRPGKKPGKATMEQ